MAYHIPGHNYIGPGTQDFNKQPVDDDDTIASAHDRAYSNAKTNEDVRRADRDAIRDFAAVGGVHGYVGAAGLAIKYGVESLTGVLYPKIPTREGRARHHPYQQVPAPPEYSSDESPPSYRSVESPPQFSSGEQYEPSRSGNSFGSSNNLEELPSSQESSGTIIGSGMSNAGGSQPGGIGSDTGSPTPVLIGAGHNPAGSLIFTKKFQLNTAGWQFTSIQNTSFRPYGGTSYNVLATPLAVLDPNNLLLFMDEGEFARLPPYAFAKKCKLSVKPLGYRLPFATNATASTFANSQTLVQCCWATGLNHKFNGVVAGYGNNSAGNASKPTSLVRDSGAAGKLYGNATEIGAIVGVPRLWNWQYTIEQHASMASMHLMKAYTICNVNDVKGTTVCSLEYTYHCAPLTRNYSDANNFKYGIATNERPRTFQRSRPGLSTAAASTSASTNNYIVDSRQSNRDSEFVLKYTQPVEKGWFMSIGNGKLIDKAPPHLNFGCMPLQSNTALAEAATFSDVVIQWEVSTELEVGFITDSAYSDRLSGPWLMHWDLFYERGLESGDSNSIDPNIWNGFYNGRTFWDKSISPATSITQEFAITNFTVEAEPTVVTEDMDAEYEMLPPSDIVRKKQLFRKI